MERWISVLGLVVMLACGWLLSAHKAKVSLKAVFGGLALQFALGMTILWTAPGRAAFQALSAGFEGLIGCGFEGIRMVFGKDFAEHYVAFVVLPIIVIFSALTSVLFYLGVMQFLTRIMAVVMRATLGASGAESLVAAANVFVGQTSAPLVAKPYLNRMTESEVMTVMLSGFATVSGSTLAAYMSFGANPEYLLAACVMNAPASIVMAKLLQPELEEPETLAKVNPDGTMSGGGLQVVDPDPAVNLVHAATKGTEEGLKMALSVGAMLISFVALIAMLNAGIAGLGGYVQPWLNATFGWSFNEPWSLEMFVGWVFWPFAWVMGVPYEDCGRVGRLFGLKLVTNEFLSFEQFGKVLQSDHPLSPRAAMLSTFAMCGFANLGSIGIQIGGLKDVMPAREKMLAKLGFRAMLGGTLATFLTACVAGILIDDPQPGRLPSQAGAATASAPDLVEPSAAATGDAPGPIATGESTSATSVPVATPEPSGPAAPPASVGTPAP